MVTDPIGDFLTRIRNAQQRRKDSITLPSTKMLVAIADILKKEGFVEGYEVVEEVPQNKLILNLRYINDVPAIRELMRVSKPGVRKYRGYKNIKAVKKGLGISIFSTPVGVITGEEAIKSHVGGEHLCDIY